MRQTILCFSIWAGFSGVILAQTTSSGIMGWQPDFTMSGAPNSVARPEPTPKLHILAADIEPGSIRIDQFWTHSGKPATNNFAVRFTYNEAGARKLLAFQREHAGQEVVIRIGGVEWRTTMASGERQSTGSTGKGWFESRTDKILGVSEREAKRIAKNLRER
jgi:hypothetical protein